MKILNKPSKPVRQTYIYDFYLDIDECKLCDLEIIIKGAYEKSKESLAPCHSCKSLPFEFIMSPIYIKMDSYNGEILAYFNYDESDKDYEKRLKKYEVKLKEWEEWNEKYGSEIRAAQRENQKKLEKERLEKEMARLKKKLSKL